MAKTSSKRKISAVKKTEVPITNPSRGSTEGATVEACFGKSGSKQSIMVFSPQIGGESRGRVRNACSSTSPARKLNRAIGGAPGEESASVRRRPSPQRHFPQNQTSPSRSARSRFITAVAESLPLGTSLYRSLRMTSPASNHNQDKSPKAKNRYPSPQHQDTVNNPVVLSCRRIILAAIKDQLIHRRADFVIRGLHQREP